MIIFSVGTTVYFLSCMGDELAVHKKKVAGQSLAKFKDLLQQCIIEYTGATQKINLT